MRQVLFNILLNAVEASPPESEIAVTVEVCSASVVIAIADQGCGIPSQAQPKIFEPFFTTKEGIPGRGLGLGLPTSKNLLETMGGSIEFRSREPSPGAIFEVTLPCNGQFGRRNHV